MLKQTARCTFLSQEAVESIVIALVLALDASDGNKDVPQRHGTDVYLLLSVFGGTRSVGCDATSGMFKKRARDCQFEEAR